MSNVANQPFADVLAKTFPPPNGEKVFLAGETAKKMLAFWSVKQSTKSFVLAVDGITVQFQLHSCPKCGQHLSAQSLRMTESKRELVATLTAQIEARLRAEMASKASKKQARKPKPAPVPVQAAPTSEEDMSLEELDALTQPGGAA